MKLSIIIVSYNTKDNLCECVQSLERFLDKGTEVAIIHPD